jgi:uncharacterized protein (DUF983 family)
MTAAKDRSLFSDLWRGIRARCPNCGTGRLFYKYLKVRDNCSVCGEELHHHRADDFPPYVVIFLVAHIIMPLLVAVETRLHPPYWVHMAIWLPAAVILVLVLLPSVKGAIIALQWRIGMHGFETSKKLRLGLTTQ